MKNELEQASSWLSQVSEREKFLESYWWKYGKAAGELYAQKDKDDGVNIQKAVYNILYSNTEVLLPSLYSAQPKPAVRARFKDVDIKPVPQVIERFLTLATDSVMPGFESFNDGMEDCVLGSLVQGAGIIRIRQYDEEDFPLQIESVPYNRFIWGKTKKWGKTPWVAFKHDLTEQMVKKQLGVTATEYDLNYEGDDKDKRNCCVYEIWDKVSRKIHFLSENWKPKAFKTVDDTLQLKGFFPTPGLLMLTKKHGEYLPTPLYQYYRNQAEELDRVTTRLNKVLSALKVRGAYNTLLGDDIARILAVDDSENMLVPAAEGAMLAQNGGFDRQIWLLPIEKLVQVAQQLYTAREQIKNVIYELTGISDIIRGSNVASETATATNVKDKWGTIRLRKMQTAVGNYVRDLFRMLTEAGANTIPPEKWREIVQLPIPTEQDKAQAQAQIQAQMQQALMASPQVDSSGQPIPPKPPEPDPQLLQTLQSPSIEEIVEKIKSDVDRTFTVNIQTSSTIDSDTAFDKAEVTEFMNAMGQLMAGLQPLAGLPGGIEVAKSILLAAVSRYKFGDEIAEQIKKVQQPPPPQPEDPSPQEMELVKAEHAAKMEELTFKKQEAVEKHKMEMEKMAMEREKMQMEMAKIRAQTQAMIQKAQASVMLKAPPATPFAEKPNANV